MTTWSADQLRAFLEFIANHRLHAAFVLLATTGMRRGECLGLRWSDVDWEESSASIEQTVIMVHHDVEIGSPKLIAGAARCRSIPERSPYCGSIANGSWKSAC
jgi:integrase